MKDILFSSGVGFGIGALFTIVRLPIPGDDANLLI
ncbi:XapX domain-containing protein [Escherichia coli]|nr:XapX domain-containing protein [Escherichia coli]